MSQSDVPSGKKCRIAEIVQYTCELENQESGSPQVHCFPIPRIFRICPGRPAVEITKLVNVNMRTGEVDIPPETSQNLPKAKPWRDIIRYDQPLEQQTDQ
ncbi:hypothetical protein JAAARDRAFT_32634 [Jaapia argillacea MUCL 33604]|uniref:Uncharacterized protein n=1 Tax=Jaapia argillacea MUCL 33604 TaxID=933084 RepID=A0A067Q276_9AGAM|nr:hypothetical protein JAAARDRAFT_32634 [Jaapia argillacea MUCL 33604]